MFNELRWAARRLIRRMGFSVVFVAILGTNLAIMVTVGTIARATLGAALPYDEEDALYVLSEANAEQDIERVESSLASMEDWLSRGRAFESIGAVRPQLNLTLDMPDGVTRVSGAVVTRSMFEALRVQPTLGRAFTAEEDAPRAGVASVILSYESWRTRFGADPDILDRTLVLNGRAWSVVGVLPDNGSLDPVVTQPIDVWLPVGMAADIDGPPVYTSRLYRIFTLVGRLRPDASLSDIERDLTSLTNGLAQDHPEFSDGWEWNAQPLRSRVLAGIGTPIMALFVGGVLLFAVAVVNLLALYLQRLRAEYGQLVTRLVVGARPADLVRLSLVELLLLGVASGVYGSGISALALHFLPQWLPVDLPIHVFVDFSWVVVLGGVLVAAASLVVVGLVGMSVVLRGLERSTAANGRIVGTTAGFHRVSQASLAAQVTLSTFLAIGSAVAVRSFSQLSGTDPGIDPEGLTALRVDIPAEQRSMDGVEVAADEILRQITLIPTVDRAFLWSPHVPTEANWFTRVRLFDQPDVPDAELPTVRINTVGPGAVTAAGLTVVAGRDLTDADRRSGRRVTLISASAARAWWGDESAAIGRTMKRWSHEEWSEVVGVVKDAPLSGRLGEGSDFFTDVYFLFGQDPQRNLVFMVRSRPRATTSAEELRAAVRAAASDLPAYDIGTMADRLASQDALVRTSAILSSLFALTAVFLAALGLYGALSFVVNRKRKEIGLRQALGASPPRLVGELLRRGSSVVFLGIIAGAVLAWIGLRPIDAALFVAGPHDIPSYVTAMFILLWTSLIALLLPSLRALRATPGESLRHD